MPPVSAQTRRPPARSAKSLAAKAAFRARMAEMGATVLGDYVNARTPVLVRCAAGHNCTPRPLNVQQGWGICKVCAGQDPATAKAGFRARLAELGAQLLEPEWLGALQKHHVRCAAGHDCWPTPHSVQKGNGICRVCAHRARAAASLVAETEFRARLDELGAMLLEAEYLGNRRPHRVRCAEGHVCWPTPAHVRQGHGPCRVCAGNDPATAETAFRARLAELGAVPLYEKYLGANRPHHVRCAEGHDCWPAPTSVQRGQGICRECAGVDPATTEAAFRSRLAELDATPLYEKWLGALQKHHVRCAAGHDCWPTPHSVQRGQGICRECAGMAWDVFYVVTHGSKPHVKFGITSGDPRPRLREHRRDGYTNVL